MSVKDENSRRQAASGAMARRDFLFADAREATAAVDTAPVLPAPADSSWQQTSDRRIRMGVVGGGFGQSFHWHEHPNCIVEAVTDLLPERRDQLMGKYQCAKSYESLEKMLLDPKIDAVAVFSGAPDHARHVVACMEHGKHAISAVPACLSLEEAALMKDVKERTGLKYMMAETSAYRWETITARRLVQDNAIGEVLYCEAEYYHPRSPGERERLWFRDGRRTWRYGLPPMFYPTHGTAFLVSVTGERLVKVSCIGTRDTEEPAYRNRDNVYDNPFCDAMGMFLTDRLHPFRCNMARSLRAGGERAQWLGRNGAIYMPGSGGQPFSLSIGGKSMAGMPDYWHMLPEPMRYDSGHGKSHPFIANEFIMALVEDREPRVNLYEALAYTVPGIVAHQSCLRDGEQLTIPNFDRTLRSPRELA